MTGLPQMFEPKPRVLDERTPEQRAAENRLEDARRYQISAMYNSYADRALHVSYGTVSATERIACEQYAYVRYLMGIDDYWTTLPGRVIVPRVNH